jgi:type II secretory pathway component PulJ
MTAHRIVNASLFALLLVFFAIGQLLDGPSDHNTEMAQAADLMQAQQEQDATLRRDLAAAQQCREQHGEASFTWNSHNQLVCIPRKGKATIQLAQVQQ